MEKIRQLRLFTKTLAVIVILFGVIATATSVLSAYTLYRSLTVEYESKGVAIAESVADSSAEILLNRDLSTVQAIIDQYAEIRGVAYVFVVDGDGDIVSHTFVPAVPVEISEFLQQLSSKDRRGEGHMRKLHVGGMGDVIDIYSPILAGVAGSVHVGMDQTMIRSAIWSAVIQQQGLMLVIFFVSVALVYVFIRRISQPLTHLAEYTRTLAAQDFSSALHIPADIEALPHKSKDEIGSLAESFIYMERTLHKYIEDLKETTATKERIESELNIARDIQMSMVPKTFPPFPNRREFDLYATLIPAKEVGGDFYDFFFVDDDHLCMAIGDVSDKGVPASLLMAVTRTLFRAAGGRLRSPDGILSRLNSEICRDNDARMFVTFFCAILNVETGRIVYSNGGHNPPYVFSREGHIRPLEKTRGRVLGINPDAEFGQATVILPPGDGILLYTDGVTEATDGGENLFSETRLEQYLGTVNSTSAKELIQGLVDEIRKFSVGVPQSDDITILALRYLGRSNV